MRVDALSDGANKRTIPSGTVVHSKLLEPAETAQGVACLLDCIAQPAFEDHETYHKRDCGEDCDDDADAPRGRIRAPEILHPRPEAERREEDAQEVETDLHEPGRRGRFLSKVLSAVRTEVPLGRDRLVALRAERRCLWKVHMTYPSIAHRKIKSSLVQFRVLTFLAREPCYFVLCLSYSILDPSRTLGFIFSIINIR